MREEGARVAIVLAARGNAGASRRGAARAGLRPPSLREARAAHPLGRLGGRGDGRRHQACDDARPHRLLRAEAVDDARRALPSPRLGVPPGVEARDRGPARAHGRRRPLVVARVRDPEPSREDRGSPRVLFERLRRGPRSPADVRVLGHGQARGGAAGRHRLARSVRRGAGQARVPGPDRARGARANSTS